MIVLWYWLYISRSYFYFVNVPTTITATQFFIWFDWNKKEKKLSWHGYLTKGLLLPHRSVYGEMKVNTEGRIEWTRWISAWSNSGKKCWQTGNVSTLRILILVLWHLQLCSCDLEISQEVSSFLDRKAYKFLHMKANFHWKATVSLIFPLNSILMGDIAWQEVLQFEMSPLGIIYIHFACSLYAD